MTARSAPRLGLPPGTTLGHYEVSGLIDAGGMGEVYRGRDTRLGRDVALKVLPAAFSRDPHRVARFDREAHLLATLNHPNISTLHGLEESDGRHVLVMELIEGETLAQRIARGPVPIPEALDLAHQIADALEAAHAQGILHRDLKPANVKVTPEGRVKLLDFGLAKAFTPGATSASTEATADPPGELTQQGIILGTVRYMSPEQAQGQPVDERTDIWSFGAVLFEMLSGRRAFEGETTSGILAAVLKDEPDWDALPSDGPRGVTRLLRRCLEKRPRDRLHAIGDARLELHDLLAKPAETETDAVVPSRPDRAARARWLWAVVGIAGFAAGTLVDRLWTADPEPTPSANVVRSEIDLTAERPLRSPQGSSQPLPRTEVALSPDGTLLVWAGRPSDGSARSALYRRRLDTGAVDRIAGTENASQPVFSPDGRRIAFVALPDDHRSSVLRKVPVDGGFVVDLAELSFWPMGLSWTPDGRILLGSDAGGVEWAPSDGGPPRPLTSHDPTREASHRLPSLLPGGDALLITTMPIGWGITAQVEAVRLPGGERHVVVEDAADARYLPTGHLVFARQGSVMAAPFDPDRLALAAPPVPVLEGVSQGLNLPTSYLTSGAAQLATSESGLLVYAPGGISQEAPADLVLVSRSGEVRPLDGFENPLVYHSFGFSPDGGQLAFVENVTSGRLWLFDVGRRTHRLLSDRGQASTPSWSPDGRRLLASRSEVGPFHLWITSAARPDWRRLTEGDAHDVAPSWSPDGRIVAFCRMASSGSSMDIHLYRFEDGAVSPFLTTPALEFAPDFSPDGRWLAYVSDVSGRSEVYVTSFPDQETTLTVSDQGGGEPAWSRDGRRLFYPSGRTDGTFAMMAVEVRGESPLALGRPTELFRLPARRFQLTAAPFRAYDLHPDGQEFLVKRTEQQEPPAPVTHLTLVHDWFAELERLSPTSP